MYSGDEYKTIRGSDLSRPFLHHLMFVTRATRHSWGQGLVEEGHWEVAEVEEPSVNSVSLSNLLENPFDLAFRKTDPGVCWR